MSTPNSPPLFIPWHQCLEALDDYQLKLYAAWRGFSWDFCLHLRDERLLGIYRNRMGTYFCYPVFGPGGAVIAEQVFTQSNDPDVPKSYFTAGAAGNLSPVILGPLPHAASIFPAESAHDAFAFADRSGLWKDPDACFIATRGSSTDKLFNGLPWPKPNGHPPPDLILLCQNDKDVGQDGSTANERWVKRIAPRLPFATTDGIRRNRTRTLMTGRGPGSQKPSWQTSWTG
jgi:hypothetical protein